MDYESVDFTSNVEHTKFINLCRDYLSPKDLTLHRRFI